MAKMRAYTFYDGDQEPKTVDAVSYKKAVKSFQTNAKSKEVRVEWQAKKGGVYEKQQTLPLGRSKKLGK